MSEALPGSAFAFTQPIEMRVQELIGGVKADVGIKIFGSDLARLRELSGRMARLVAAMPGASDVRVEPISGLSMLTLEPDMRRLGQLGVRADDFSEFVELLRTGRRVGRLVEGERRFDVVMRAAVLPVPDDGPMQKLRVPLAGGRSVPLGDLARVEMSEGPAQVSREQGRRRILIEANVRGRDLLSFVQDLKTRAQSLELPTGYWLEYGGEYENLASASARLAIVVPLTLLAILVLLYIAFGTWRPALLIFVKCRPQTGGLSPSRSAVSIFPSAPRGSVAVRGRDPQRHGVLVRCPPRQVSRSGEAASQRGARAMRPVPVTALARRSDLPMRLHGRGVEFSVRRDRGDRRLITASCHFLRYRAFRAARVADGAPQSSRRSQGT